MKLLVKPLVGYKNLIIFTVYYFSTALLISTFFTPWKRYSWKKTKRGIHPTEMLYIGVSNVLARIIGAVLRTVMILIGLCGLLGILILGLPIAIFVTVADPYSHIFKLQNLLKVRALASDWHFGYTPMLDPYSQDLYETVLKFPLVDRKDEILSITRAITQSEEGNLLLVGEPGSGREVILTKLAHDITTKRFLVFDYIAFLKDKKDDSQKEGALEEVLFEASRAGNVTLIFDNFEDMIPFSHILDDFLPLKDFHIIGITSPDSYHSDILPNKTLMKHFETISITQLSKSYVQEALSQRVQATPSVRIEDSQISTLLEASYQLLSSESKHQPEAAITLFDEFASYYEQHKKDHSTQTILTTFLEHRLHVPFATITDRGKRKLKNLEYVLKQYIVGQDTAISEIARSLKRRVLALSSETKPIGSFLFLGPTGVGKTETAKALAHIFFEDQKKLLRFDMAAYQNELQVTALVDDLARKIRETPYGVLLMDEFEKAHKELINIFLTILDEGYFYDSHHNQVICNNIIIIATSNAGSEFIREHNPESSELIDFILKQNIFSPELLNRFDSVVAYSPLSSETIQTIIQMKLESFNRKLVKINQTPLTITDELIRQVEQGSKVEFGAREIDRAIKRLVEDKIADKLLNS